jgi:hypothetical protein
MSDYSRGGTFERRAGETAAKRQVFGRADIFTVEERSR